MYMKRNVHKDKESEFQHKKIRFPLVRNSCYNFRDKHIISGILFCPVWTGINVINNLVNNYMGMGALCIL